MFDHFELLAADRRTTCIGYREEPTQRAFSGQSRLNQLALDAYWFALPFAFLPRAPVVCPMELGLYFTNALPFELGGLISGIKLCLRVDVRQRRRASQDVIDEDADLLCAHPDS